MNDKGVGRKVNRRLTLDIEFSFKNIEAYITFVI